MIWLFIKSFALGIVWAANAHIVRRINLGY